MGADYWIDIVVDQEPNRNSIQKILKRGEQLGFSYIGEEGAASNTLTLSVDKATNLMVENFEYSLQHPRDYNKVAKLMFKGKDAGGTLFFDEREGRLQLSIVPPNLHYNEEGYQKIADFRTYTKVLIDLCADFAIYKMKTFNSYYNAC